MAPPTRLDLLAFLSNLFISSTSRWMKKNRNNNNIFLKKFFFTILLTYRYGQTFFPADRFFFHPRDVLEINSLDKIARRSKRVGGAIADLWGSHLVDLGVYYM